MCGFGLSRLTSLLRGDRLGWLPRCWQRCCHRGDRMSRLRCVPAGAYSTGSRGVGAGAAAGVAMGLKPCGHGPAHRHPTDLHLGLVAGSVCTTAAGIRRPPPSAVAVSSAIATGAASATGRQPLRDGLHLQTGLPFDSVDHGDRFVMRGGVDDRLTIRRPDNCHFGGGFSHSLRNQAQLRQPGWRIGTCNWASACSAALQQRLPATTCSVSAAEACRAAATASALGMVMTGTAGSSAFT